MKVKEYDAKKLLKPTVISFIGSGVYHKTSFILNIINYWIELKLKPKNKFELNIFSPQLDLLTGFLKHSCTYKLYNDSRSIKDFYNYKQYQLKDNINLEHEVVLIDFNLYSIDENRYPCLEKLVKNYKKYNLTIILCGYTLLKPIEKITKYFIFLSTLDRFNELVYKYYSKRHSKEKFIEYFKELTSNDGLIVCHKKFNGKFYKLKDVKDKVKEEEERRRNASFSDNIIFF